MSTACFLRRRVFPGWRPKDIDHLPWGFFHGSNGLVWFDLFDYYTVVNFLETPEGHKRTLNVFELCDQLVWLSYLREFLVHRKHACARQGTNSLFGKFQVWKNVRKRAWDSLKHKADLQYLSALHRTVTGGLWCVVKTEIFAAVLYLSQPRVSSWQEQLYCCTSKPQTP